MKNHMKKFKTKKEIARKCGKNEEVKEAEGKITTNTKNMIYDVVVNVLFTPD